MRKRSLSRRLAIMSLFQGLPRSKSVKRLKTFGILCVRSALRFKIDLVGNGGSLLTAESLKRNCKPYPYRVGLLQPFIKSSNKFLTSRKSSVGKVSANADALMIDRFPLSRIESLFESSKSSKGGQRRDSSLRSSLRSSLQSQTRLTLASRL